MALLLIIALGAALVMAFVFGAMGVVATRNGRDWVSGLFYGVPAVLLSTLLLIFSVEFRWVSLAVVGTLALLVGAYAICRGYRVGSRGCKISSAIVVISAVVIFAVAVLSFPAVRKGIISPFVPAVPIL